MNNNRCKSVVIDTNILLDYYNTDRKGHKNASSFFKHLHTEQIQFYIAYHSLVDYVYLQKDYFKSNTDFTSRQAENIIVSSLNMILDYLTVVGADHFDMKLGIKSFARHQDFEDNLVIAAAERANADYVLTSDAEMLKDYPEIAISYEDLFRRL